MSNRFPLQAVLRFREQKEQVEERALLAINADIQQVRTAMLRIEQEIARFQSVRDQLTRQVISAAHHQMLGSQWRTLQDTHMQLAQRLQALDASKQAQQSRLMSASRDREMLSELREHHIRVSQKAEELRERKRIDDLFSSRCALGGSSSILRPSQNPGSEA